MPGKSLSTVTVTIRLRRDVVTILRRRAQATRFTSIGSYIRHRIEYDTTRKHGGKK